MLQPRSSLKIGQALQSIDSASAAATPQVAETAVSSTALSNTANSVGGYTAGTLQAMHDARLCQMNFHRATSNEASTRVANGNGIGATIRKIHS